MLFRIYMRANGSDFFFYLSQYWDKFNKIWNFVSFYIIFERKKFCGGWVNNGPSGKSTVHILDIIYIGETG